MESQIPEVRKIHRRCFKQLRRQCSQKVSTKILKDFADSLPTNVSELAAIASTFRRSKTDLAIIIQVCRTAKLKLEALYKSGTLPDAQVLEIDSSTQLTPYSRPWMFKVSKTVAMLS